MTTLTTTHPVIRLEVEIPLDTPTLIQRHRNDTDLLATIVSWRFVITADPTDYRCGGYETVTMFGAESDNFTYFQHDEVPEWVPRPSGWDAIKAAAVASQVRPCGVCNGSGTVNYGTAEEPLAGTCWNCSEQVQA